MVQFIQTSSQQWGGGEGWRRLRRAGGAWFTHRTVRIKQEGWMGYKNQTQSTCQHAPSLRFADPGSNICISLQEKSLNNHFHLSHLQCRCSLCWCRFTFVSRSEPTQEHKECHGDSVFIFSLSAPAVNILTSKHLSSHCANTPLWPGTKLVPAWPVKHPNLKKPSILHQLHILTCTVCLGWNSGKFSWQQKLSESKKTGKLVWQRRKIDGNQWRNDWNTEAGF